MKLINEQRDEHSVVKLCALLKIDPNTYYRHCRQQGCSAVVSDECIVQCIRESYQQSRKIYGRPRIHQDLRKKGIRIGSTRLARLMKQEGIDFLATLHFQNDGCMS